MRKWCILFVCKLLGVWLICDVVSERNTQQPLLFRMICFWRTCMCVNCVCSWFTDCVIKWSTHFINMYTPVGSIARLIPFHEATILYFCLAVRGRRGSGGSGAGGSASPRRLLLPSPPSRCTMTNLPSSQPMFLKPCRHLLIRFHLRSIYSSNR